MEGVLLMEWYWVFCNEETNRYVVLTDKQVTGDVRWNLQDDGYEVLTDCGTSYYAASKLAEEYNLTPIKYEIRPITLKQANQFVISNHRHHFKTQGHKFSLSLVVDEKVVGVIIAGRPVSRHQDNGLTLEVTRCCVADQYKNGISKLYSAICRVAQAMGYKRVITYTLLTENGSSMRASNFQLERKSKGGSWNSKSRERIDKHPLEEKLLWIREVS